MVGSLPRLVDSSGADGIVEKGSDEDRDTDSVDEVGDGELIEDGTLSEAMREQW